MKWHFLKSLVNLLMGNILLLYISLIICDTDQFFNIVLVSVKIMFLTLSFFSVKVYLLFVD